MIDIEAISKHTVMELHQRLVASERSEGGTWRDQKPDSKKLATFLRNHYGAEIKRAPKEDPEIFDGILAHTINGKGFLLHPEGVAEVPAKIANRVLEVGERYRIAKNGPEGDYEVIDRDAVERLKHSWMGSPVWDIEDTFGFEPYRNELSMFSQAMKTHWKEDWKQRMSSHPGDEYVVTKDEGSGMVGFRRVNETDQTYFGGIPAILNFANDHPEVPERVINELLARDGGYTGFRECRDVDGDLVLMHHDGYRWIVDINEDVAWARAAESAVKKHILVEEQIRTSMDKQQPDIEKRIDAQADHVQVPRSFFLGLAALHHKLWHEGCWVGTANLGQKDIGPLILEAMAQLHTNPDLSQLLEAAYSEINLSTSKTTSGGPGR